MQARAVFVLRSQQPVKSLCKIITQSEHFGAFQLQGRAFAQLHQACKPPFNGGLAASQRSQTLAQFAFAARRQGMEQRHVSLEEIAFRREMSLPQLIGV